MARRQRQPEGKAPATADPALRRLIALQRVKGGTAPSSVERADTRSDFRAAGDELRRVARRLGGIVEAWDDLVPARLRDRAAILGFDRGILTVTVDSSPTLYALDRELRSGLEAALREATGGRLQRVRGKVGKVQDEPDPE